ncbi:MAG: hypothetical protein ACI31M_03150 [Bacilli bacterium]
MKRLKFEKLNNNSKKIILVGVLTVFIIIGIIISKNTYSVSTDSPLSNKVVDGLSFENANIDVENGISTFTAEVINESGNDYSLKTITITLSDGTDTIILTGYIGNDLTKEEKKVLKVSTDQQLDNITNVNYSINK